MEFVPIKLSASDFGRLTVRHDCCIVVPELPLYADIPPPSVL